MGAAAAAGAAGGGGGGSGLSSMAGAGPVPSGLPQPGTSKKINQLGVNRNKFMSIFFLKKLKEQYEYLFILHFQSEADHYFHRLLSHPFKP